MVVVDHHEHALTGHRHSAIDAARGVADQVACAPPLVMPDLSSGAGVQSVALIGASHIHDSVDHNRGHLERSCVDEWEDPLRREARYIALRYLLQRAVTISTVLAMIGWPIGLAGDLAIARAVLAQQMDVQVVSEQLHVLKALI